MSIGCQSAAYRRSELRRQREAEERRRAELEEEEAERAQREADERAAAAVHASDSEEGRMLHRARLTTRCVGGRGWEGVMFVSICQFTFLDAHLETIH